MARPNQRKQSKGSAQPIKQPAYVEAAQRVRQLERELKAAKRELGKQRGYYDREIARGPIRKLERERKKAEERSVVTQLDKLISSGLWGGDYKKGKKLTEYAAKKAKRLWREFGSGIERGTLIPFNINKVSIKGGGNRGKLRKEAEAAGYKVVGNSVVVPVDQKFGERGAKVKATLAFDKKSGLYEVKGRILYPGEPGKRRRGQWINTVIASPETIEANIEKFTERVNRFFRKHRKKAIQLKIGNNYIPGRYYRKEELIERAVMYKTDNKELIRFLASVELEAWGEDDEDDGDND